MEFKHYCFLTVLICSLWALTVSGLTNIEKLGDIELKSELSVVNGGEDNNFGELPLENKFASIIKVLNTALPLALVAIVLLVITYSSNPIGVGSLAVAVGMFFFASTKTMDAIAIIEATSDFSVSPRVWWM